MSNYTTTTENQNSDAFIAEMALHQFEAWEGRAEDNNCVPSNREYAEGIGIKLRVCLAIMHKSKAELIEMCEKAWADTDVEDAENVADMMFTHVRQAVVFAECMATLTKAAESRFMVAMAALAARDDASSS